MLSIALHTYGPRLYVGTTAEMFMFDFALPSREASGKEEQVMNSGAPWIQR